MQHSLRFPAYENENTSGDLLFSITCSHHTPFIAGDESYHLGIASPFSIVSNTHLIVISSETEKFFSKLNEFSPLSVTATRELSKINFDNTMSMVKSAISKLIKKQKAKAALNKNQ
jgi:hypothetical protein